MITAPQGAERDQLEGWSTKRLLRYLASRRTRVANYVAGFCPCYHGCSCGPMDMTDTDKQTAAAMRAEIDFIKSILAKREHVK